MVNTKINASILASLLYLEAVLMVACVGVGLYYGERDFSAFVLPMCIAVVLGSLLKFYSRGANRHMSRRDGYLIVSITWVVFTAVGMLPLLVGGYETRVAAAFFEIMSGFTTTGATVLTNIDSLPPSILFWRSLTHWMGGMGIVFFTIAVLPTMGTGDLKLFSAEATGMKLGKLHPRIRTTAQWLWAIYLTLTVSCALALWLAGMSPFDAVNHAMSTAATGGFSTHQDGIAWFQSSAVEYVELAFMFLASINFTLLYLLLIKGRPRSEFKHILHPRAMLPVRIDGTTLTSQVVRTLTAFTALYLLLHIVSTFILVWTGLPFLDALAVSISSFSNVGPAFGHLFSPLDAWNSLSDAGLWTCSFMMLAGRLEIFSLLLPFFPSFWREN